MSRPCHCRRIEQEVKQADFVPLGMDAEAETIILGHDCYEAIRLYDLEGMSSSQAAEQMGISRHTFGRLLRKAHREIARAICRRQPLRIADGPCAVNNSTQTNGENIMSEAILVAVPSEAPGGLDAAPSAHFGHCAFYTVAKVENGQISDIHIVPNKEHEHGGCAQPVQELAAQGVKALLAGGMGMKPLAAMQQSGIEVYYCVNQPTVGDALKAFGQGKLQAFGKEQLCSGCHGHH